MIENENPNSPEELIIRFLAGETNKEETNTILEKLKNEKEWMDIYAKTRKIFDATNAVNIENKIDTDKAIQKFLNKTSETINKSNNARPLALINLLKIAAVFVIIFVIWKLYTIHSTTVLSSNNAAKSGIKLPDGSVIDLSSNSNISFEKKLKGKTRSVILNGTAFFNVIKNPDRPFIIETKSLFIKVVGTSFKVYSNSKDSMIAVAVKTGRVLLYEKNKNDLVISDSLLLLAGDSGKWEQYEHKFFKYSPDSISIGNLDIRFNNTPLSEAVKILAKTYHVQIIIANRAIDNCKITAHFENQKLESIFEILRTILNINIKNENGTFIIDGHGC